MKGRRLPLPMLPKSRAPPAPSRMVPAAPEGGPHRAGRGGYPAGRPPGRPGERPRAWARGRCAYWIFWETSRTVSTTFSGSGMYPISSAIFWPSVMQYSMSLRETSALASSMSVGKMSQVKVAIG